MTLPPGYGSHERLIVLEKFRIATQGLDRELAQFWPRAFFFGGFTAFALAGYLAASLVHAPLMQIFSVSAGLFIAVCWIAASLAGRFSQSVWEGRVIFLEDYSVGPLFQVDEGEGRRHPFKSGMRFSVSALMMVFSLTAAAVFVGLLLFTVLDTPGLSRFWRMATAGVIVLFFAGAGFAALRVSRTAARETPQGVQDVLRYIDIP